MNSENLKDSAGRILSDVMRRGGFSGTYDLEERIETNPHFEGHIKLPQFNQIHVAYNPVYEESRPGQILKVVRDIGKHEINHKGMDGYSGCPRNVDLHDKQIITPISEVLKPLGFSGDDFHYFANALEDTLLHIDLSNGNNLEGITEFLRDVTQNGSTDFYEAHTRLNMALWGNKSQKSELGQFYTTDNTKRAKIVSAVKNFLERSGISKLKTKVLLGSKEVEVKDREAIRDFINDENNWKDIARIYAEEFSKIATPNYSMPLFNHSGNGTRGKGSKSSSSKGGNQFDKEMNSKEYKLRRIQEANSNGEEAPAWIDSFEAQDLIYQSLARKLNLKVESFTESKEFPSFWYGSRDFNPEKDSLKRVRFGIRKDGTVGLVKRKYSENMQIPVKTSPRGVPDIRIGLIDSSGSMQCSPEGGRNIGSTKIIPWGDNSRYHYAVLGWYGLLEYLKENHLSSQTNVGLGVFSSSTQYVDGLEESKKLILNPNFGGSTMIDSKVARNVVSGEGNLIFTISDGDIYNWSDIKDDFIKGALRNNYFHLQIGNDSNEMLDDLEKNGLKSVRISNANDLSQKIIDLTDSEFRGEQ
jgi:hypothetical protein